MKTLIFTAPISEKLAKKHGVTEYEVRQCFENLCGTHVEDDRELHRTDPPTYWFVSETNQQRLLKVIFVFKDGNIYIKSAYAANAAAIALYEQRGK